MPLTVPDYPTGTGPSPAAYDAQSAPASSDWQAISNSLAGAATLVGGGAVTPGNVVYSTTLAGSTALSTSYTLSSGDGSGSITVAPVATALPQGTPLVITSGANSQYFNTVLAVSASATSLNPGNSINAGNWNFNYPVGSTIAVPDLYVMVSAYQAFGSTGGTGAQLSGWVEYVDGGLVTPVTYGNIGVRLLAADPTNPRIDYIVLVPVAGGRPYPGVRSGTPAANPSPPALSAGDVPLATVYVPAGATAITASMITDKRVQVQLPVVASFMNLSANTAAASTSSATMVELMNYFSLAKMSVAFYAPPSGSVMIEAQVDGCYVSAAGTTMRWQMFDTTATPTALGSPLTVCSSTTPISVCQSFFFRGLTPGSYHVYELYWAAAGGGTVTYQPTASGSPSMALTALPLGA